MPVFVPSSLDAALAALSEAPDSLLLAGGTDVMVEINERHRDLGWPDASVISLTGVPELTSWTVDPGAGTLTLGAGVRWSEVEREPLASMVPALAQAARTVGSPQIRNAGTVGGNLATCSPAGDGLPVLAAHEATVRMVSGAGERSMPVTDFMVGVKRTALEPGELIVSVTLPLLDGYQGYSKVGVRNAMVIATASACLTVDTPSRSIRIALGSVAPTIVRCVDAEAHASATVDWTTMSIPFDDARRAGRLAADAASPIDDHRSTAAYRRHAVGVMVERHLIRAFPGARS